MEEWRPDYPVTYAPLFCWPPRPVALFNWFFCWPGYLQPWNAIYLMVTVLSVQATNPDIEACATIQFGWVLQLFVRNLVLLWIFAGGWHWLLYQKKVNGLTQKYDKRWPETNSSKFLFKDQVYDNVFWSCTSGVGVWTLYEALYLYCCANRLVPVYTNWWAAALYSCALLHIIPIWREFHFYFIHRLIHWKPLYRSVHYLHHRNVNPTAWSGLSMHPVEHLFYFSVVLIHFVVPSHPIHFFFNAQHTALTPAGGHHGFEGPVGKDGKIPTGSYFHYLHHRYFECNYGEATIPLDYWFGTFRDGKSAGKNLKATSGGI
eukprot:TRINITY_DN67377_c3_g1_i1.p1 TRINITY_DN67377_c3_g1~~TRINITY_DN67377_c3_g1_i1.p1  ORF type:complete len:317 (+),score=-2.86 TRINITY_DN67377_c3_g1_i1:15-965(+)